MSAGCPLLLLCCPLSPIFTMLSCCRGYINYYSVYLFWLGSAVFVHLPSFQSMGIDVKADISMLLTIFLLSLLILGALHAIHAVAVFFKVMSPALYSPGVGRRNMYTLVILNSLNLAVACSTYYSFCGNAGLKQKDGSAGEFRAAICNKWLHPVAIRDHPAFASWVLYGEGAGLGNSQPKGAHILNIDVPFDGLGLISIPASETISPVFTMWITLVAMYTIHCWADYQAAVDMRARSASSLRHQLAGSGRSSRRQRRYSQGYTPSTPKTEDSMQRAATLFEPLGVDFRRRLSINGIAESLGSTFLSSMSRNLDTLLSPGLSASLDHAPQPRSSSGAQKGRAKQMNHQGVQAKEHDEHNVGKTGDQRTQQGEGGEEQPEFLPMFPWYSGTSADMYRTVFELLVSVKLFLGRFDMRTMQAATATNPPGSASDPPRAGDGFTFEHLADRPQLWLDFCADTGDGGDPTYAVARAMAAPGLKVAVPAGTQLPDIDLRPNPGVKGRSAPAAFGAKPKLAGTPEPWQRGRTHTSKSPSPVKAVRHSPHHRPMSPGSDTSSGLGTPVASDSEDASSGFEDAHSHVQLTTRKVSFREHDSPLDNSSNSPQSRPGWMESPFDAAAQIAHPVTDAAEGQGHGQHGPAPQGMTSRPANMVQLPRADVLVIGGDLAYPHPSNETYEQRFFRPFEAALPPPPHVRPGRLVVYKPDLPGAADLQHTSSSQPHATAGSVSGAVQNPSRASASADLLHEYDGPTAFAIPGNHDWIDGLETYTRHIQHKGWLGGWLLPQEKSYFALALPHGWWLLGLDLALVDDIDMCQCRYFARIADERMGADDQAILVTHQPRWLSDWFWDETACHNLRQLVRGHLRGRARVHLAGDLHFYMRHSFRPFQAQPSRRASQDPPATAPSKPADKAASDPAPVDFTPYSPTGMSPAESQGTSFSSRHQSSDIPSAHSVTHGAKLGRSMQSTHAGPAVLQTSSKQLGHGMMNGTSSSVGVPVHVRVSTGQQKLSMAEPATYASSSTSATSADDVAELQSRRLSGDGASSSGQATVSGWHPHDPEHLIVNGLGGAFLHPTHVFSPSRFVSVPDPSADEATVTSTRPTANTLPRGRSPPRGSSPRGSSPSRGNSPRGSSPMARFIRGSSPRAADAAAVKAEENEEAELWGGGEYHCAAAYPSPPCSMQLGRQNLHLFRLKNTRFDVIGGIFYFCLVVSVLPRCSSVSAVLDAHSLSEALQYVMEAVSDALGIIFTESYISLAALLAMFLMAFGFASAGGVGASSAPAGSTVAKFAKDQDSVRSRLALRARTGGAVTKCVFAFVHTAVHLLVALMLMVLLELGVETCIRYESVGKEGYHSLYKWYQAFEAEHFPDPKGLRDTVARWTLHIYPNCIQAAMALFDVPEAIAVSRTQICNAGGIKELSRLQAGAYYMGMLAYYWVLATPAVGFLFGCYLYIAVNWFHVHYDEAFSALRIPNFKGFSRLHINTDGDLEIYGLAMDKVPCAWREDPKWRSSQGAGNRKGYSHKADYPSRWIPAKGRRHSELDDYDGLESQQAGDIWVMDYLLVPKVRPAWKSQ
ncbi:TPA: hypothetical protein ACH3X3_008941 [Trebouxia sp. C0006]